MSRPILEVIALTVDDAVAAGAGGADRLEVVTDMAADGLSPAPELVKAIRSAVPVPLRVMLRVSDGFAAGDVGEVCRTAAALRAAGADEFVLGFLDTADSSVDVDAVSAVLEVIDGCAWTFHRALDRVADRGTARKQLDGLPGLDTFLTAGSADGVDAGIGTLIAEAALRAAGEPGHEPRILAGGGLRIAHLAPLLAAGVDAFHVGGAVRPAGWSGPVAVESVREWREHLG